LAEHSKNHITDWQTEIDDTFAELLKERERVKDEFIYFCNKIRELNLHIHSLSLGQIQQLLSTIKNTED
jgi:predicted nucleic acid-binding OB-fold protein